uniref:Uncharacterized protein n=1 Tax=Oryza glumipatula TaxID=40148 RepID=A0A0D9YKG9_9ORYZ
MGPFDDDWRPFCAVDPSIRPRRSPSPATASSVAGVRLPPPHTRLGRLLGLHSPEVSSLAPPRRFPSIPPARWVPPSCRFRLRSGGAMGSKDSQVEATLQDGNKEDEEDDWEAIADRGENDETLTLARSFEQQAKVSPSSSSEKISTPSSGPKRRGRGSFLYDKSVLYSDQCGLENDMDEQESNDQSGSKGRVDEQKHKSNAAAKQYGTRHVLVLYDFPPSTLAADLEKIFDKFGDHGVAIRWVNDTVALAVFRTPSAANEAQACIPPRYKVRPLKEDDDLLTKNDGIDLEPPTPRPKTSARTAQRLIAHGMGLRQFTNFGSDELKKQEEARSRRIAARQALRDDAWGSD